LPAEATDEIKVGKDVMYKVWLGQHFASDSETDFTMLLPFFPPQMIIVVQLDGHTTVPTVQRITRTNIVI
jgi:hypothetical protein